MAGDFVDLIAWRESVILARDVFRLSSALRGPGRSLSADQLRRAVESIPANIAEGHGRGTNRDFARFLNIAAASAAEVESHLRVSPGNGWVGDEKGPARARLPPPRAG